VKKGKEKEFEMKERKGDGYMGRLRALNGKGR